MSQFHLLYWVFKWLEARNILDIMLKEFYDDKWNDKATATLKESLQERYQAYLKVKP